VLSNLDYQLKNSPYGQLPLELAAVELLTIQAQPAPVVTRAATTAPVRPAAPARPRPTTPEPQTAPVRQAPPTLEPQPASVPEVAAPSPVAEVVVEDVTTDLPPVESAPIEQAAEPAETLVTAAAPASIIEVEDSGAFFLDEVLAVWPQFIDDIRAESKLVHAQIDGVMPINIEDKTVVLLASKGQWQKGKLEQEKTRRLLERMLSKLLRSPALIRATMDEREEMPDTRKQLQHARNDPMVRKALNIFDAEVIGIDTL
jgi:DNA polymerase-3 subunit gamma/tau